MKRALQIGCGAVLALVAVAAVIVALNWPRVKEVYHRAAATMSELNGVHAAVQRKYGGQVDAAAMRYSGFDGTSLKVTLVNPPFLDQLDPDTPAGREKALEIAAAARAALPAGSTYERYEVVLVRRREVVATVWHTWPFQFEPGDLPPPVR